MDYSLLKNLCEIFGPSGDEGDVKEFIINYFNQNSSHFKKKPTLHYGDQFQDCLVAVFGTPRTAVFCHMDSHGFTVRYENQLVSIGYPEVKDGIELVGEDSLGPIECRLKVDKDGRLFYDFGRPIERGTQLVYSMNFRETENTVQSCYLDNRLGVMMMLKLAHELEDGMICFSCWEEHGGGSVPYLAKFAFEEYNIKQALIADITWATEGVALGDGTVISMRDRNVPRRSFIEKIIKIANSSDVKFQLEVEGSGSSDGRELQTSTYPFDWCFIGPPEDHVHSPDEIASKSDIEETIKLYKILMNTL